MKNYWFYLESYSFIFEGIQGLIIYNTLNGRVVGDNDNHEIRNLIKKLKQPDSGYCTSLTDGQLENPEIAAFISAVRKTFSGDIIDISLSDGKPFIFKPILDLLNDAKKVKDEEGYILKEDVLESIHEVNFYLTSSCKKKCEYCQSYYKQFLFCTNCDELTLSIENYRMLFDHFSTIGLQRINLLGGDLVSTSLLQELVILLRLYEFKIEVYTHYDFVNEKLISVLSDINNVTLVILADSSINSLEIENVIACTRQVSVNYHFIVSSEIEYIHINKIIENYNFDYDILPFFNGNNIDFFKQNVFVDLDDILSNPVNKQQIFRRQVMNENFYGKLYVMPNGEVFANLNNPALGNLQINSLNELVYNEISERKNWFLRREKKPCSDCTFKLLCPSPSNYELAMDRMNMCNL